MNAKLYAQLLLAMLVGNYAVAYDDNSFFNTIGRSYNSSSEALDPVLTKKTTERISPRDARKLKQTSKEIVGKVSSLRAEKTDLIKSKIEELNDLMDKSQVTKMKGNKFQ